MYRWVLPRIAVPVHGESRHMKCNAAIAKAASVPFQLLGLNGDCFDLINGRIKRAAAPVGRLWFDENKQRLEKVSEPC